MHLRPEQADDAHAIRRLTTRAFENAPHSSGTEPAIIDALRNAGGLTLSLVAEQDSTVVGHVAFSPVEVAGEGMWFGLGPISVEPAKQGGGIGSALIEAGLDHLRDAGAAGCVVLGDPAWYPRFGFQRDPRWTYAGAPPEYFMVLPFWPASGSGGAVRYHPAFG